VQGRPELPGRCRMPHIHSHHVTVELKKDYQFVARFDDVDGAPTLVCDEPAPLGDGRGPNAAAVLGAAVGNCLAASLAFCLRKARMEPVELTARVTTRVARNEQGRSRIAGIDVVLSPAFAAQDEGRQERCQQLFEDFCTVTASIRHGIPVSVSLATDAATNAA
jgi:organic hydroperoxide reductase OsmC/OhrA